MHCHRNSFKGWHKRIVLPDVGHFLTSSVRLKSPV